MAVVEVAGDVISTDRPEPSISLSFTDRVMSALNPPQEPRVARIVRFRRAAAFLGPLFSAAAVWMVVVTAVPPVDSVPTPAPLVDADGGAAPQTAAVIVEAPVPVTGSATIADALAEGPLSMAMSTWNDARRSTRDLAAVVGLVLSAAGEPLSIPSQEEGDDAEVGIASQAEAMLEWLTPKTTPESVEEGPDVL
jgi:hypothetical protein